MKTLHPEKIAHGEQVHLSSVSLHLYCDALQHVSIISALQTCPKKEFIISFNPLTPGGSLLMSKIVWC